MAPMAVMCYGVKSASVSWDAAWYNSGASERQWRNMASSHRMAARKGVMRWRLRAHQQMPLVFKTNARGAAVYAVAWRASKRKQSWRVAALAASLACRAGTWRGIAALSAASLASLRVKT